MRWNKSTRLALYATLEMAKAGKDLVTASEIATRFGMSQHHLAKVLQQLVRAGIARAEMGTTGGYRLARSPRDLTVLEIVEVFEGRLAPDKCVLADDRGSCGDMTSCRIKKLFDEIDQQAFFTLKSTTLSALVGTPARV
jgi:Rrf2 family protein